jgi:hypothetical protein
VRAILDSGMCDTTMTDLKGRTPAEDTKDEVRKACDAGAARFTVDTV